MCQRHAELNKPLLHGLEEKQNVAKTRKYTSKVTDHPGFSALSEIRYFKGSYNKEIPSEQKHCFFVNVKSCRVFLDRLLALEDERELQAPHSEAVHQLGMEERDGSRGSPFVYVKRSHASSVFWV